MFYVRFSRRTERMSLSPIEELRFISNNRLCGLVVRVLGRKPRGPGFDSRLYQILWLAAGVERGPFNFVKINEELLERKMAAWV
jgi:hypothetical protein